MTSLSVRVLGAVLGASAAAVVVACGSDTVNPVSFGTPPDASAYNPGQGGSGGYGDGGSGPVNPVPEAGPPTCPDSLKLCAETFTYPYNGETSVELRGDYRTGAWTKGDAMTRSGSAWTVSVDVPWNQQVLYKFFVNGTTWTVDMAQPTINDDAGNTNNVKQPITCPNDYTCSQPAVPPAGVFDWRDAVIYFAFVDRFFDGNPANNCSVAGADSTSTSSANYLGGDWAGITQQINANYFTHLGVNVLWLTVPLKNADDVAQPGYTCNGSCTTDGHSYTAYHGYWPTDPSQTETCFGQPSDLNALVQAAHAKNIKVLFDYAMVHLHTESAVYQQHKSDGWFTPFCQCGDTNDGCGNYDNYTCWFTPYLAHFDFTNSSAARTFSVSSAVQLVQSYGNDAFRLDAIKQVDPSWLAALRPAIASQVTAAQSPPQRFYMVGETYDFQNRGLIASLIDSTSKLDGQFDFPLRIRLVEALLMRSTQNMLTPDDLSWSRNAPPGMTGLQQFMDSNDTFYPPDAVMSTFVGNHDLPRSIHFAEQTLPSWLGSSATDGKGAAWSGQPSLETDPSVYERMANAFAVLLTNRGAPLIYYGDEIGLPGAGDPDNRRMMQWTGTIQPQQDLHDRVAALAAIRAAHPAMRRGARTTLDVSEDLWVYSMATGAGDPTPDTVYVAINRSDNDLTTSALPSGLTELLTNTPEGGSPVTIPARQTRIFK